MEGLEYRMNAHIIGTGSFLPEKVVTNFDLAERMETNDEWIVSRTGIRQRHIAVEESTAGMAAEAARRAGDDSFSHGFPGSYCAKCSL